MAARARPFGVRVVALKRDPASRHDAGVAVDELLPWTRSTRRFRAPITSA